MSELLKRIRAVGEAADRLTRACAREGAIAEAGPHDNPVVTALRRSFRATSVTPNDMMASLRRVR